MRSSRGGGMERSDVAGMDERPLKVHGIHEFDGGIGSRAGIDVETGSDDGAALIGEAGARKQ